MKVKRYWIKYNSITYEYKNKKDAKKDFPDIEPQIIEVNIVPLIELHLLNNCDQEFEKGFDSIKECNNFINKLKRGNKLKITAIYSYSDSVLKEIRI